MARAKLERPVCENADLEQAAKNEESEDIADKEPGARDCLFCWLPCASFLGGRGSQLGLDGQSATTRPFSAHLKPVFISLVLVLLPLNRVGLFL